MNIAEILHAYSWHATGEREVQDAVELALSDAGVVFEREAALDAASRVDFLCGHIAIEIKTDGSLAMVTRQLHRYAKSERVAEIVLVTTRAKHLAVPASVRGKPVRAVWLRRM